MANLFPSGGGDFSGIAAVLDQFADHGMPEISPSELQIDTTGWVRYGPKKKAYYRIERRVSRAGNEYFVGAFGFKGTGQARRTPTSKPAIRASGQRPSIAVSPRANWLKRLSRKPTHSGMPRRASRALPVAIAMPSIS